MFVPSGKRGTTCSARRMAESTPAAEERIRTDLLELALVWADLRVRLASKDRSEEARREAIEVLDQAEAVCGPSPALSRERRACAEKIGRHDPSLGPEPAPRSAWEHYDLGRSYPSFGIPPRGGCGISTHAGPAASRLLAEFLSGPLCLPPEAVRSLRRRLPHLHRACTRDGGMLLQPRTGQCGAGEERACFQRLQPRPRAGSRFDVGRDQSRDPLLRGRPPPGCAERLPASTPGCQLGPGDRSAASTTISPSPTWRSVMWPAPLPSAEAAVDAGYRDARKLLDSLRQGR